MDIFYILVGAVLGSSFAMSGGWCMRPNSKQYGVDEFISGMWGFVIGSFLLLVFFSWIMYGTPFAGWIFIIFGIPVLAVVFYRSRTFGESPLTR